MAKNNIWKTVLEECPKSPDLEIHANGLVVHHEIEVAGRKMIVCEANPGNEEKEVLTVTKNWLRAAVQTLRDRVGATA